MRAEKPCGTTVVVPSSTISAGPSSDMPGPSAVRSWMAADYPNIVHWSEQPRGGHFAAFEQPELFVADVRTCFRQFR